MIDQKVEAVQQDKLLGRSAGNPIADANEEEKDDKRSSPESKHSQLISFVIVQNGSYSPQELSCDEVSEYSFGFSDSDEDEPAAKIDKEEED